MEFLILCTILLFIMKVAKFLLIIKLAMVSRNKYGRILNENCLLEMKELNNYLKRKYLIERELANNYPDKSPIPPGQAVLYNYIFFSK